MSPYFSKVSGGVSVCQDPDEERYGVRFPIGRQGEDGTLILDAYWREHPQTRDLAVIPLFAYGLAPRIGLCTKASLEAVLSLARATVPPNSTTAQQWTKTCCHFGLEFSSPEPATPNPPSTVRASNSSAKRKAA
jgi:hypothetical protein